ncbi:polysaccharide deacetylase family protein [Paenibacillus sp. LMG 31461]|uniref:Polysaccharide deacetylase family protein n=2 Tax=Paenibacillus plantarum TaxID=2654975 RepID=A0ABX1XKT7_9BACL|nr:polysaccharide deacetylase family protein [Paenibacillus plantarum]
MPNGVVTPYASSKVSIPVLNYHSVTIDPGNVVVISPAKLEAQMKYLSDHGYTPISLTTFINLIEKKSVHAAPDKPVLLTFDDGYVDNVEEAMPILAKYNFPATLFMSPGMVEDAGYLNWEQVKQLQQAGWDIQPHGMTHPHLPKLSAEQQAYEITEARKLIEEKLGTQADVFCYPYGEYNQTTLKVLKDYGFRYAFTIDQGYTTNQQYPYSLKRLFINGEESLKAFINKLPKTN